MKALFTALAVGVVAFVVSACGSAPTLTFAQQVQIVCSATNTELTTLQAAGVFTGGAQTTLTKQIQPDVAQVCASGATVTTVNLQNLVNATLPAVVTIVSNSSLSAQDKNVATVAIGGVATAVNVAIALMPAAVPTDPASAPVAASAPVSQ